MKDSECSPESQFASMRTFSYHSSMSILRPVAPTNVPKSKRILSIAFLALAPITAVVVLWSSCKDTLTGTTPDVIFPATKVSYSQHVDVLFAEACAVAGCHAGSSPAKDLNLERPSYINLMSFNTPILVHPKDTVNSPLLMYLDGRLAPIMPPTNRPRLTANQIRGMKQWVLEGALNN
jgi:hypothetical protein